MKFFIDFIIIFVFIYVFYLISVVLRKKNKKFNPDKLKTEESYLMIKYKIDFTKVKYRQFLNIMALTNAFILAIAFACVQYIKGLFWQILSGFFIMIPVVLILYTLIGRYYKKQQNLTEEVVKPKKKQK